MTCSLQAGSRVYEAPLHGGKGTAPAFAICPEQLIESAHLMLM